MKSVDSKRLKEIQEELLRSVASFCDDHNLEYFLAYGTLIGAVRHKGFIPWDDDMDIEMLRPDYERLMKVLPEELPETMALQSHNTDKNYFFFYAKVRDRRSLMEESNHYDRVFKEKGIFVDIFPFEKQPLWVHRISELAQGHVYKIMNRKEGNELVAMRKVRFITSMNEKIIFPILGLFCKLSNARETYGLGIPYHDPRHLEDILPLTTTEFEGRLFPVPKDCDKVLTLKYGDYMCLPDVSNISLHVGKLVIDN